MADSIVMSSGHSLKVRGAAHFLDEVNEARRVVEKVAEYLRQIGTNITTFHDNTSTTKDQNLATIVNFHNSRVRELDVSIHFNAASVTSDPRGTEVYYYDDSTLASSVSAAIATAGGFKNRGGKQNQGFYFLNQTEKKALLIEVCFVDSSHDANLYNQRFDAICRAIAESLAGKAIPTPVAPPVDSQRHVKIVNVNSAAIMMDKPDRINGTNIGTIPLGTVVDMIVPVAGYNNEGIGYYKVVYQGKTGYINAKYGQEV